jgi:hypothetical protein
MSAPDEQKRGKMGYAATGQRHWRELLAGWRGRMQSHAPGQTDGRLAAIVMPVPS